MHDATLADFLSFLYEYIEIKSWINVIINLPILSVMFQKNTICIHTNNSIIDVNFMFLFLFTSIIQPFIIIKYNTAIIFLNVSVKAFPVFQTR